MRQIAWRRSYRGELRPLHLVNLAWTAGGLPVTGKQQDRRIVRRFFVIFNKNKRPVVVRTHNDLPHKQSSGQFAEDRGLARNYLTLNWCRGRESNPNALSDNGF